MKPLISGVTYLSRHFLVISFITIIVLIGSNPPLIQGQNNTEINQKIYVPFHEGTLIGISLDTNCQTYLKKNYTSNCPTYEEINSIYPSFECVYKGRYCLNHLRQINKTNGYIINPSAEVMDRIKMIEIRLNFEEFHKQGKNEGYDDINHTINYGVGRYVDSCRLAYVDSNNWMALTGDTIMYFFSNCTKTYLNEGYSVAINQTVHNIADSYKYKLEQWQKEVINKCGSKLCLYAESNYTGSPP